MAAEKVDQDRKAKIAAMQRQAKSDERRRTLTIVGAAVVIVTLMAGAVTFAIVRDTSKVPAGKLSSLGATQAAAKCDPETTDVAKGGGEHVGPNTPQSTVKKVKYTTVPPSSGQHFAVPAFPARQFYTATDRPKLEALVHNLEHGYSILWYDATASTEQIAELKAISREANDSASAQKKFIVSAWDESYGALPAEKHFALSHWSANANDPKKQAGHRVLCGGVSGAVVEKFITAHPLTDAPEAGAQ